MSTWYEFPVQRKQETQKAEQEFARALRRAVDVAAVIVDERLHGMPDAAALRPRHDLVRHRRRLPYAIVPA